VIYRAPVPSTTATSHLREFQAAQCAGVELSLRRSDSTANRSEQLMVFSARLSRSSSPLLGSCGSRTLPVQRSVDRFYNSLQERGDCQTPSKSYKTTRIVGWVVGWKGSRLLRRLRRVSRSSTFSYFAQGKGGHVTNLRRQRRNRDLQP
jgi:hypothetical protein